jgi:hypothetical protein
MLTTKTVRFGSLGAVWWIAAALLLALPAGAERLIPFQGRVTDGAGEPLQGVYRVTYAIYDVPTGGSALWVETHETVSILAGQVNVLLGTMTPLDDPNKDDNPADAISFADDLVPRFLGIKIGDDLNEEMVPRHELIPSFHARIADTTVEGGVDTPQLADGAVTLAKVAPEVVVPPGAIMPFAGTEAPPGWVLCDGVTYEGTNPVYAELFGAIGTTWGGSGTQFQVPDLRGTFLRGVDGGAKVDPDADSRTGGDAVGSSQSSAVVRLDGITLARPTVPGPFGPFPAPESFTTTNGTHNHTETHRFQRSTTRCATTAIGGECFRAVTPREASTNNFITDQLIDDAEGHRHVVDFADVEVSITPTVGASSSESRPANVAVNYICKL